MNELLKKIIIISVFVLILSVILAAIKDSNVKRSVHVASDYTIDQVNEIIIKSKSASIEISPSLDDQVHIYERKNRQNYQVERDSNKLIISDMSNYPEFCFLFCSNKEVEYMIKIPKSYQKSVSVIANVADVTIKNVYLDDLSLSNDVGDIEASNIKTEKLEITNNIGDISLEHVKALMKIQNNVGDIEIEDWNVSGNSNLQTDTGDIEVEFSLDSSCQITASTSVGKVEKNDFYILGNGDYTVDLNTSIGNVSYELYH